MAEYIYIASNSSMPGLLKIGRTCSAPTVRMSELHTTGVPTPFKLEFVGKVGDSQFVERRVHETLRSVRVSRGREFFRTDVRSAILATLSVVGPIEVDWNHTTNTFDIAALVDEQERARRLKEAENERQLKETETRRARVREQALTDIKQRTEPIVSQLARAEYDILLLGARPERPKVDDALSRFAEVGLGCLFPLPCLLVFSTKLSSVGWVSVGMLLISYLIHDANKAKLAKHASALQPWIELDKAIRDLKQKLSNLEREKELLDAPPTAPIPKWQASRRRYRYKRRRR